ncbi:MAG: hypothetical protein QM770_11760 [Tepidisphaeraceae bacterium]
MNAAVSQRTAMYAHTLRTKQQRQRKLSMIAGALVLVGFGAGGYFGYEWWKSSKQEAAAKQAVQEIAQASTVTPSLFEKLRSNVQSGVLTREQAGDAMMGLFNRVQDGYFALPPNSKQRDAYLDKIIDQMESMRKQYGAQNPTTGPTTRPGPLGGGPSEAQRTEWEKNRQTRLDKMSPDRRAKMAEFIGAMLKRRAERGLPAAGPGQRMFGGGPR